MPGFLTKARQETGADKPKFGGGGSWVDIDAMVARETVFGITRVEWDGENEYNGTPRPRWVLDVIPWYESETLPGKAGDDGRLTQLDAGKLGLASHRSRDDFMDQLQQALEQSQDQDPDYVEGPGVLVKIRVPGGKGGRYIDLCEWDEENERPILSQGTERAPEEDEQPRRPSGRSAPARSRQDAAPATRSPRRRQAEAEPEPEPEPEPERSTRRPAARRQAEPEAPAQGGSAGFAGAGGAERDGGRKATVPTPAGAPISAADLKIVSDLVGGEPYASAEELAEEYELEEGTPFPGIKPWLTDHGINDFPKGRGRIKPQYRDAYSIALRCWMEVNDRDANGEPMGEDEPEDNASRTSPNPAVRDGTVTPSGAEHVRQVRRAEVPDNAHAADEVTRPADAPVRPDNKAAWLPPDQRERGAAPATEHVYAPGDVGDSVEPCPGCQVVVTGRALPMGGGSYGIMHECPKDQVTRPLQATNIRKG